MRLPHLPSGATRFFARPLAGVLECPRCGHVLSFNSSVGRHRSSVGWDSRTSRLRCPACEMTVMLGLIAWPVVQGSGGATLPRDQTPHERQLGQMRAMGGLGNGWWMPRDQAKKARRADHTNVTAGCSCTERGDGTPGLDDPRCPIHGEGVEGAEGWRTRGDHTV